MEEYQNMTSEFNEAQNQIWRLNTIWIVCHKYRETGKLLQWKWKLEGAQIELNADAERLDKTIKDEKEKWIKRLENINESINKSESSKKLKEMYENLIKKEMILRSLQESSGKGAKYRPHDDDDM
jgi:flagellar motility protein MotE (MotC chaperone)